MFPSEIEILVAADKAGGYKKSQLNHSMDVVGEYIGYLYDSLIRRGFIAGNRLTGYRVTSKGRERIRQYLSRDMPPKTGRDSHRRQRVWLNS